MGSNGGSTWDNIISCHPGLSYAQTWSFAKKSIGSHKLSSSDGSLVLSSAISLCGHFGFIGTASGSLEIYNLQSGLHRGFVKHGSFPVKAIASSSDGTSFLSAIIIEEKELSVKFWSFKNKKLLSEQKTLLSHDSVHHFKSVQKIFLSQHVDSDLVGLGIGCQIFIYDFSLQKIVRFLNAPNDHILTSISFSTDGKWLISTGNDCYVRIWDIPSGTQLDCISIFPLLPVGATLSPSGDTLAIIDTTSVAIQLW